MHNGHITNHIGKKEYSKSYYNCLRVQTPDIIHEIKINSGIKAFYNFLKRTTGEDGYCCRSITTMAEEFGAAENTIRKYLKELAKPRKELNGKALIKIKRRKKKNGNHDTSLITIVNIWKESEDFCRVPKIKSNSIVREAIQTRKKSSIQKNISTANFEGELIKQSNIKIKLCLDKNKVIHVGGKDEGSNNIFKNNFPSPMENTLFFQKEREPNKIASPVPEKLHSPRKKPPDKNATRNYVNSLNKEQKESYDFIMQIAPEKGEKVKSDDVTAWMQSCGFSAAEVRNAGVVYLMHQREGAFKGPRPHSQGAAMRSILDKGLLYRHPDYASNFEYAKNSVPGLPCADMTKSYVNFKASNMTEAVSLNIVAEEFKRTFDHYADKCTGYLKKLRYSREQQGAN